MEPATNAVFLRACTWRANVSCVGTIAWLASWLYDPEIGCARLAGVILVIVLFYYNEWRLLRLPQFRQRTRLTTQGLLILWTNLNSFKSLYPHIKSLEDHRVQMLQFATTIAGGVLVILFLLNPRYRQKLSTLI